jgi:hypothetical protein
MHFNVAEGSEIAARNDRRPHQMGRSCRSFRFFRIYRRGLTLWILIPGEEGASGPTVPTGQIEPPPT